MLRCLVRGCGDVGSAVAHALFVAGHRVAIHDVPGPTYPRRGMAFVDTMFDGRATLEGVMSKRAPDLPHLLEMTECGRAIPMVSADLQATLAAIQPDVLIDARMRKREIPERQAGLAPLTIGLGPNFIAGLTTDVVVETARGDHLGEIIHSGPSLPFEGGPRMIAGHGRGRFVYAPCAGQFETALALGTEVAPNEPIGTIDDRTIRAPMRGTLVGLTRNGVLVGRGAKIVEVDPRCNPRLAFGIGERPARIAAGVLKAVGSSGFVVAA